jgi:hypothetical protein
MSLIRGLVSARTWLAFTHHAVGLVLSIASFTIVVTGFAVGLATTPLAFVGLPVIGCPAGPPTRGAATGGRSCPPRH